MNETCAKCGAFTSAQPICHKCNPPERPCGIADCHSCYERERNPPGPAVEPGVSPSNADVLCAMVKRMDDVFERIEDMGKREDRQATWIGRVEDRIVGLERAIVRIEQSMRDSFHRHHYTGEITMGPGSMPQYGGALPVDQASPTVRLVAERDEARVKLKEAEATISRFANERDDAIAKQKADAKGYAAAIKRVTDERDVARNEAHTMRCSMSMHLRVFPWENK